MPGLGATMDALSGWAEHRKGTVHASPDEQSHTVARTAAAGAGWHLAFCRRVTQAGRQEQPLPLARR
jgi:hypothetical protein